MSGITSRCCGSECEFERRQGESGPCWGEVAVVDEETECDDDGNIVDSMWIHCCDGHAKMWGGGAYKAKP